MAQEGRSGGPPDRSRSGAEGSLLIEFARTWAPYGGPPEQDLLVHFGMTADRFIERLWHVVPESDCTPAEIRHLERVYPRDWHGPAESVAPIADGELARRFDRRASTPAAGLTRRRWW
ncbi:hypothetical protein ACFTWF_03740 [Rhodococcus sp. NPDC056960]|uniref:hypothetical protein n=1 Tax=Rhodococcus sp. NPDC056960 TaxID=3345982 RepID=UPI00363DE416